MLGKNEGQSVFESSTLCTFCQGHTFENDERERCVGCGFPLRSRRIYAQITSITKFAKYAPVAIVLFVVFTSVTSKFKTKDEYGAQEPAADHFTAVTARPQRANLPSSAEATDIRNKRRIPPRPGKPPVPIQLLADEQPTPHSIPKTTWGAHFNPDNAVPSEGFYAFYFDSSKPADLVNPEQVEKISVEYNRNDFRGIDSQDFAAYWVGAINTREKTTFKVKADKGWNEFRVIIDGSIIQDYHVADRMRSPEPLTLLKANNSVQGKVDRSPREMVVLQEASAKPIPKSSQENPLITLLPGDHMIEVELRNHWHTTDFSVVFQQVLAPE